MRTDGRALFELCIEIAFHVRVRYIFEVRSSYTLEDMLYPQPECH